MEPLRLNWDSPLIVSPARSATALYFAAQYLFRSDDRGNTWKAVSPDLTRHIDRNTLPVMGRVWGVDAVAKSTSTSWYGNIVSLAESPLQEGLIYVGTDDGLDSGHRRRRRALAEDRSHRRRARHDVRLAPRSVAARRERRLRRVRQSQDRRLQAVRAQEHRPRQDLDVDRRRSARSAAARTRSSRTASIRSSSSPARSTACSSSQNGGSTWIPLKGNFPTVAVRDLWFQKRQRRSRRRHIRPRLLGARRRASAAHDVAGRRRRTKRRSSRRATRSSTSSARSSDCRANRFRATRTSPLRIRRSARSSPTTSRTS